MSANNSYNREGIPNWEQPTGKLRQVRTAEWVGDHLVITLPLQQEYKVQSGPVYMAMKRFKETDIHVTDNSMMVNRHIDNFFPITTEWRDVPIVLGKGCEVGKSDECKSE